MPLTHLADSNEEGIVRDIFWGVVLIAIGFVFGGSVFLGDFSLPSIFFDGLGVFFIARGIVQITRAKRDAAAAPPPPAARPTPPPAGRPR